MLIHMLVAIVVAQAPTFQDEPPPATPGAEIGRVEAKTPHGDKSESTPGQVCLCTTWERRNAEAKASLEGVQRRYTAASAGAIELVAEFADGSPDYTPSSFAEARALRDEIVAVGKAADEIQGTLDRIAQERKRHDADHGPGVRHPGLITGKDGVPSIPPEFPRDEMKVGAGARFFLAPASFTHAGPDLGTRRLERWASTSSASRKTGASRSWWGWSRSRSTTPRRRPWP